MLEQLLGEEISQCKKLKIKRSEKVEIPECERKTAPGVITERSCAFYGARWILAPIEDAVHIVHGIPSCAYYGRTVRKKNYTLFSTDLREKDVIMGGAKKLYETILQAVNHVEAAKAVFVYITCVPGVTGEDLSLVCKKAESEINMPVVLVNCPGFSGVSQAAGQDIAIGVLFKHFIGNSTANESHNSYAEKSVNLLGEFNVQGDLDQIEGLLARLGINVICAFSGKASIDSIARANKAKLNIVHCRRTGYKLAQAMKDKFNIPFIKLAFIGLNETASSLRKLGEYFDISRERVEALISEELDKAKKEAAQYLEILNGKKAAVFFGASRMGSVTKALKEMGMEVVMVGSQFGCSEDYKEAACQANEGAVIIDDASEKELEALLMATEPDILLGGMKEKYMAHKLGIPFMVFPQEFSAFAGFSGFVNMAREAAGLISVPVWKMVKNRYRSNSIDKGVREKVRIAVASKSGIEVDQHFGKAEQFMIFDVSGDERELIEIRKASAVEDSCEAVKNSLQCRLDLIQDCNVIVCVKAGKCVHDKMQSDNKRLIEAQGDVISVLKMLSETAD
ncbi:nitrogenase [Peptococcaceae bacterium]|nr:nitrogenase [Peptococcaceae bacterium]